MPQVLEPWDDGQPLDTLLGNAVVAPLLPEPTSTPLPTQQQMRLSAACPLLMGWPEKVLVDAPDPCSGGSPWNSLVGNWTELRGGGTAQTLVRWKETCDVMQFGADFEPVVSYRMPTGDLFGSSQTATTLFGTEIALRDCSFHTLFVASEKVEDDAGDIWIRLLLHNESGHLVAQTKKFRPFQNDFSVTDMAGHLVAEVSREGEWVPNVCDPDRTGPRRWRITYNAFADSGSFAAPTQQWPIAQMVTMLSLRDLHRTSTGLTAPPSCHEVKLVSFVGLTILLVSCAVCAHVLFMWVGVKPMQSFMWHLENRVCPQRMRTPSMHRGL